MTRGVGVGIVRSVFPTPLVSVGWLEAQLDDPDLVVLDGNPLKVDPMAIKNIKVVETIKEGRTIYTARSPHR